MAVLGIVDLLGIGPVAMVPSAVFIGRQVRCRRPGGANNDNAEQDF